MIIGLTYDLRDTYLKMGFSGEEAAEFDKEETIIALEQAIEQAGFQTERIGNIFQLTDMLAQGKRWDLVFNISEGVYGQAREAQVPALLDAYKIPYVFSGPLTLTLSLDKAYTKMILHHEGVQTHNFMRIEQWGKYEPQQLNYPLFVKPVAEGTGKGISNASKVTNPQQFSDEVQRLLQLYKQPVIAEQYLPGKEFTVGIIGTGEDAEVLGSMEIIPKQQKQDLIYGFAVKEDYENFVDYALASGSHVNEMEAMALKCYTILGCEDAGRVDIKLDVNGNPCFMEINPLAGLNPIHSDLPILCRLKGIPYNDLIKKILDSAINKIGR